MVIQLDRPGECRQCGVVLKSSDETESSLTNTSNGLRIVRQFWHRACWEKRAAESFRKWIQTLP